jgi:hypothetical protein
VQCKFCNNEILVLSIPLISTVDDRLVFAANEHGDQLEINSQKYHIWKLHHPSYQQSENFSNILYSSKSRIATMECWKELYYGSLAANGGGGGALLWSGTLIKVSKLLPCPCNYSPKRNSFKSNLKSQYGNLLWTIYKATEENSWRM